MTHLPSNGLSLSHLPARQDRPVSGKYIAVIAWLVTVLACSLFQLTLGGALPLLATVSLIALSAILPAFKKSKIDVADIVFISLCLYNGALALFIKSFLLQPVQQNLQSVSESSFVLLCGHFAILVSWVLVANVAIKVRPLSIMRQEFDSAANIEAFSKIGFVFGYIFAVLHTILRPQAVGGVDAASNGFGGFGSLYFLLLFAFAAQLSLAAARKSGHQARVAAVMFFLILALSVAGNAKKYVLDAGVIVFLTVVSFNIKIKPGLALSGLAFIFFIQFVVSPVIHITRAEAKSKTISERVDITFDVLRDNEYDIARINEQSDNIAKGFSRSYRSSGSYVYPSTVNFDRFALILPVDQVVRSGDPGRISVSSAANLLLQRILPGSMIKKQPGVLTDHIAWVYGIRTYGSVARPVIGLTASSYAVMGFTGVLAINFILMLIVFGILKAVGGPMHRSAWAVGLAVSVSLIAEMDINGLVGLIVRDLPIMIVVLGVILVGLRLLPGGRRGSSGLRPRAG